MKDVNKFIEDMELVDLQLLGRKFTWSNVQDGEKWCRIDRFLLNLDWLEKFKLKQWGLPRTLSDHCSILLKLDDRDWGPKPFKFFIVWLSNPKCLQLMEKAWTGCNVQGWAAYRIHKKLKGMKDALKIWAKEECGELQTKLDKVELELHGLDIQAESGSIDEEERIKRKKLREEMWKLCRTIDRMWWQKSRVKMAFGWG